MRLNSSNRLKDCAADDTFSRSVQHDLSLRLGSPNNEVGNVRVGNHVAHSAKVQYNRRATRGGYSADDKADIVCSFTMAAFTLVRSRSGSVPIFALTPFSVSSSVVILKRVAVGFSNTAVQ